MGVLGPLVYVGGGQAEVGSPTSKFILSSGNRGQETYLVRAGQVHRGCVRDVQLTSSEPPEALGLSLRNCPHPVEAKPSPPFSSPPAGLCSSNSSLRKPALFPGPWPQGGSSHLNSTHLFKETGSDPSHSFHTPGLVPAHLQTYRASVEPSGGSAHKLYPWALGSWTS